MKKSPNNIDLLFQSHFAQHEVALTDPDSLWLRIASDSKRKSRGLLLFLTLFLALSSWLAYSHFINHPATHINKELSENSLINTSATSSNLSPSFPASPSNQNNQPNPKSSTVIINYNNEINTEGAIAKQESITNIRNTKTATIAVIKNDLLQNDISKTQSAKSENAVSKSQESSNALNTEHIDNNTITTGPTDIVSPARLIPRELSGAAFMTTLSLAPLASQLASPPPPLKNGMIPKCEIGKNNFMPYIDVYGLLSAPLESVGLSSAAADQTQLLTNWEARFNPLTSIAAGIAIGNEWANGIGTSIGVEYQRMESQYKSTQTVTERTTIYDPMAFFYLDDNDQPVWVGDSVTSVTTYDRTIAHANTTTLLSLPLHLSYMLVERGPWNIRATAGGILNLSLQYRGRYLQSDQSLLVIDADNQSGIVAPRIGIGAEVGLDVGYLLGANWEFYASPRYRYNGTSYWQEDAAISLSRDYLGLRTGIRYHF